MQTPYRRVLTVAGSDSGGGAGIQADLKTFAALGCYGASVITALTAQNTCTVRDVLAVPAQFVTAQLDAVFEDIGADAVKVGMLHSAAVVAAVAAGLQRWDARNVVVDPVMVAKSGDRLLREDALDVLRNDLLPLAAIITPNLPEATALTGVPVETRTDMERAASSILAMGARAVLVKGGHLPAAMGCPDLLAWRLPSGGLERHWLEGERIATPNTHGTGCTLSSAIAASLALGLPLLDAVAAARRYLRGAVQAGASYSLGHGHGPLHHFYALWQPAPAGPPDSMEA